MALRKQNYETIFGAKAEHWIIQAVNVNDAYEYADITLVGYVDEDAYLNGKASIETKKVKVSYTNGFEETFSKKAKAKSSNIYALAYEYVKNNNDFFKDAEDC